MTAGRVLGGCEVCLAECQAAVAGHWADRRKGSLDLHRASCSAESRALCCLAQEPADWEGDVSVRVMIHKRGTPERVKTLCQMPKFLP